MKVRAVPDLGNTCSAIFSSHWVGEGPHPTAGTVAVSQLLPSCFGWEASPGYTKYSGSALEGTGPICTRASPMPCGCHLLPDYTLPPLPLQHQMRGHGCKVVLLREASPMYGGAGQPCRGGRAAAGEEVGRSSWLGSRLTLLHVIHHPWSFQYLLQR